MNAKQSLLQQIKKGDFALKTAAQISRLLRLGKRESRVIDDLLQSLCREGELLCDSSFRYGTAEQFGAKTGTFSANERGFGFFIPDDGSKDWFIPHRYINGALHGDKVLAVLSEKNSDDTAEILAILTRGYQEIVGTYRKEGSRGFVVPDERKYSAEVLIPHGKNNGCGQGQKVLAKINRFHGNFPEGEIMEILGEDGDFFAEELSLIRSHKLYETFPAEVVTQSQQQAARPITEKDLQNRMDLRDELIITIDGEDTRDIDDAISVKRTKLGYTLGVHIADVSHYVARGGAIDREAFKRGTSVYFPDRVLPMLPTALSNDICSLNEGADRLTLSCIMDIDRNGNVLKSDIAPSVIRSRHRMTYHAVTKLIGHDKDVCAQYPDLTEMIDVAAELTQILKHKRNLRGGVAMDIKEAKILYVDGKIIIPDYDRTLSHEMIEQFMVLANETVASYMTKREMPFVYRVHESPSEEKAKDFITFLSEAGIENKLNPYRIAPTDYQNLLQSLKDDPIYPIVNRVMLRSMMKAKYSSENVGHFGLASDCYCHFTSPIRRYPDLCIHRIIKQSLTDPEGTKRQFEAFVEKAALQSSLCEKNATEAERDVDALYIAAYMQDHIGEMFEGTVSGMTNFGLFVELPNTIEGYIPVETLPDDYYEYIESRFVLQGTKHSFHLGERVLVSVAGVDWGMRRTHFTLLKKI